MFEAIAYAVEKDQSFQGILGRMYTYIINPAIVTLFAVALLIFFYGVIIYIRDAADKDGLKKGKDHMFWGIVGFVIMIGVYGIINLLLTTFNIKGIRVDNQKIEVNQPDIPPVKLPSFKSTP